MNRRSKLQRKLESLPAPKPPANLAERIKNEIPKDLPFNVEEERERYSSSIAMNLRVAASILVLISTAYLVLNVFSRGDMTTQRVAPMTRAAVPAVAPATDSVAPQTVSIAATDEAAPTLRDARPARQKQAVAAIAELEKKKERSEARDQIVVANEPVRGRLAAVEARVADVAVAPAAAPAALPPPPAAVAAPSIAGNAAPQESAAQKTQSRNDVRYSKARDLDPQRFAAPASLPSNPVVDIEAVEESIAPGRILVRVSFDSGIAVKDLWVETRLPANAARSARWYTLGWRWGAADFPTGSRSVLVDFALSETNDDSLVTVRAHYRTGDDPIEQSVERVIRRRDVRAWSVASKRTQSAALIALYRNGADREQVLSTARASDLDDVVAAIEP